MIVYASYGGTEDSKSVFGYVLKVNGDPVEFRTRKQKIVTLSSTEAEFVGIVEAMKSALFVDSIIKFCERSEEEIVITLKNDNQSAIQMLSNQRNGHCRTRHIHTRYHFLRFYIEEGKLEVKYERSSELLADVLTKPLGRNAFEKHMKKLMNHETVTCRKESEAGECVVKGL